VLINRTSPVEELSMAEAEQRDLTTLTVELLSAYVAKNEVKSDDLAALIKTTHGALAEIDAPAPAPAAPAEPEYPPAVSVRKSLASREHLISMIDGKPYKTLKRHASRHGLTPAEYRQRYNLPADYPMVAPAYSEQRRGVAARLGLGRKGAASAEAVEAEAAQPETPQDLTAGGAAPGAVPNVEAEGRPSRRGRNMAVAPKPDDKAGSTEGVAAKKTPRGATRTAAATAASSEAAAVEKPAKKARRVTAAPQAADVDGAVEQAGPVEAATAEIEPVAKPRRRRGLKFAAAEEPVA
jgi:predicted transcriptional regulator